MLQYWTKKSHATSTHINSENHQTLTGQVKDISSARNDNDSDDTVNTVHVDVGVKNNNNDDDDDHPSQSSLHLQIVHADQGCEPSDNITKHNLLCTFMDSNLFWGKLHFNVYRIILVEMYIPYLKTSRNDVNFQFLLAISYFQFPDIYSIIDKVTHFTIFMIRLEI